MFSFARYIVRHKVGATAVCALGVFFLTPDHDEQPEQSANPWSAQAAPAQVAQVEETSFVDDLVTEASSYLDEVGINPVSDADEAVGRLDDTASAFNRVNGGS